MESWSNRATYEKSFQLDYSYWDQLGNRVMKGERGVQTIVAGSGPSAFLTLGSEIRDPDTG
jgi:hypothetical protein